MRTLIYLATIQRSDGRSPQNSWLGGTPFGSGVQPDAVAFSIPLAWKLLRDDAVGEFDPLPMVRAAARYLLVEGPVSGQERWEEASGYSPSTLAVHISALVAAAELLRERGDPASASPPEMYADFLEGHLETWTVTSRGTIHPAHPRHFVRLLPLRVDDPYPAEDGDSARVVLANRPP